MVKPKFKKSLQKAKKLERKKLRSLKQLEKAEDKFEKQENILKRCIGRIFKRKK